MMSDTEDSELLEIEVRAHRRRIRRRRYRPTCDCDGRARTLTAPLPPKLIPKGTCGISIWVHVLLDKYASYRPTERLLGQLSQYDLDLPAGAVNDGLRRIEPLLHPIHEAFLERNRQGEFHQADETRWLAFALLDGKKGYGWWLWVILGADTVIYLLDSSRSHEAPERHFGPEASGVLEVDRYSGYKAMAQVKSGLIVLAFCRAHVRRDFVGVGKSWSELTRFVDDSRIPLDNNASERAGRGPKELLRFGFPVEWPVGSGDVFAVGDAGPLETQSATVVDVVLGELCGGRRENTQRHPTVSTLESLCRTPCGIGNANRDASRHRHFMTLPITGFLTPAFPRHPLAGVKLFPGNSLR